MSRLICLIGPLLMTCFLFWAGAGTSLAASEDGDLDKEFYRELDRGVVVGTEENDVPLPDRPVGATSYFSYFLGLILLVGAAAGIAYLLRFLAKRSKTALSENNQEILEIIAQAPLGKNKYVSLVQVADKILVLGVGETGINLLTEIKDKEEIDSLKIRANARGNKHGLPFSDYLKGVFARSEPQLGNRGQEDEGLPSDYIRGQRNRLKDLSVR